MSTRFAPLAAMLLTIGLLSGPLGSAHAQATACDDATSTIDRSDAPNGQKIVGTPGPDVIFGSPFDDVIDGLAGDDVICGGDGNDRIDGGLGHDELDGGRGIDFCNGGSGTDEASACESEANVP